MDRIDRRILALYQTDTRRIATSIGAEVGLSAAAVQRRLKRLRASGTIRSEIAVLDPRAARVPVLCIVLLTMAPRPRPATYLDRFREEMRRLPEVQQCYQVTGTSDFVVVVTAENVEDFGAFVHKQFEANEYISRFESFVVIDRVKVGLSLPVPTD
jgi:Lrp/AsnC family transcriptional regulator, leucine-responsive regulatory protein